MSDRFWSDWPERSRPRPVEGGVRAKSGRRGTFAKNWWGQQFLAALAALDPYDGPSRLQRGRSYARRGQVLNVDIAAGRVDSKVQGSRARPYRVHIELRTLSDAAWRSAATALGTRAADLAALLGGTLTPGAEEAFEAGGSSLFPTSAHDLTTQCSCPDWANPCKHIAAVYYLVAEELDRDPLLLLALRGVERDAFVAAAVEAAGAQGGEEGLGEGDAREAGSETAGEALPVEHAAFWGAPIQAPAVNPVPARLDAPLVRGLGEVPFWRGEQAMLPFAVAVLCQAAETASMLLADPQALAAGAKSRREADSSV